MVLLIWKEVKSTMENQMNDQTFSASAQPGLCRITPKNSQNDHYIVKTYRFCKDCKVFGGPLMHTPLILPDGVLGAY